ncbi:MAG: Lrp/AsnC family transcriptional regulator [Candidatus Woesearchaeota archaeon]
MKLDEKDLEILGILKQNAKLTTSQISKQTKIPITTVHNRIKKLESIGVIRNYTVVLNHQLLGKDLLVYVLVGVDQNLPGKIISQDEIAKKIKAYEEVEEANIITGDNDIIVKARFKSIAQLNNFIMKKLRKIDGVDKTKTMVVLEEI